MTNSEYPQVVASFKAISNDNISFYHRQDYNTSWSTAHSIKMGNNDGEYYLGDGATLLNTMTLGPSMQVKEEPFGLDVQSEYLQFKISGDLITEPWTLYAYSFANKTIAIVKQEV